VPIHVSIHDVSPIFASELERALELCAAVGNRPALLVVPNYHGRAHLADDTVFCDRLRSLQRSGHEVYLHGFLHETDLRPIHETFRERVRWVLWQQILSAREAELAPLTEAQGRDRVLEGERALRAVGLRIDGYVAPAWAMPRWLAPLLAERRIRYTEDHVRIHDPCTGKSRASAVLNWATRTRGRLLSSAAWCRLARPARTLVPVRIAIHPADLRVPLVEREIARTLAWARGDLVATGSSLLG
jgi:predicted deacetylase